MTAIEILRNSFKAGDTGSAVQLLKRGVDTPDIRRAVLRHRFGKGWEGHENIRRCVYRTPDGKREIAGFHSRSEWDFAKNNINKIPEDAIVLVSIQDSTSSGLVPSSGGGSNHASSGYVIVNGRRYDGGYHSGTSDGFSSMAFAKALVTALEELYREMLG